MSGRAVRLVIAPALIESLPVLLSVYWLVLDRGLTFYFWGKCSRCPRACALPWVGHCDDCLRRQVGLARTSAAPPRKEQG